MKKNALSFVEIVLSLLMIGFLSHLFAEPVRDMIHRSAEPELVSLFIILGEFFILNVLSYYVARGRSVPSFVMALLIGIAAKPMLSLLAEHSGATVIAVATISAIYILFHGGVGTARKNFQRLFWKIIALAAPGTLMTAFLFALALNVLGAILGTPLGPTTCLLLGVALASTDPAAIIPLIGPMQFKDDSIKDIAIGESAVNDVVGAMLTLAALGILSGSGTGFTSVTSGFASLFSVGSALILVEQTFYGALAGIVGWLLLRLFSWRKLHHGFEAGADGIFFLFIPLFAFVAALLFGGSGYLAAFIAGLLFELSNHLEKTGHFLEEHVVDGLAKPTIFLLLGSLVDLGSLGQYALIGIISALVFVFVVRPLTVLVMLSVFTTKLTKERLSWQQLAFLAWVRETGAIPAVLLVTIASRAIPGTEALVPIGMWVILLTLIVQPLATPWLARKLQLV